MNDKKDTAIRIFNLNLKEKVSGVWDEGVPVIRHMVIELVGVASKDLESGVLEAKFSEIIISLGLHSVDSYTHLFSPHGQSTIFVLEESHLALHSWPEKHYLHIDLVTCSKKETDSLKLIEVFKKFLAPKSIRVMNLIY